ncbi:MAG: OmpH family outer membrane protein [Blastocatellia bacterium]|nr:OmpH family outer membrane protein [Blastocatellia bacterium]
MKTTHLFAVALMLTAIFSVPSIAQTAQPNQVTSKIVIVDTSAFFTDKTGITRIINASKQLDSELGPKRNELQQLVTRTQNLEKEIETLQRNVQNKVPVDQKSAQAKVDELERLRREGKFKQDEYNSLVKNRQEQLLGPPYAETMKSLAEYIKTKGFGIVFDVSKDQNGMLIFATEQYDITRDFIAFYNSRPVTATTPTTPRPTTTPSAKPPVKP